MVNKTQKRREKNKKNRVKDKNDFINLNEGGGEKINQGAVEIKMSNFGGGKYGRGKGGGGKYGRGKNSGGESGRKRINGNGG